MPMILMEFARTNGICQRLHLNLQLWPRKGSQGDEQSVEQR